MFEQQYDSRQGQLNADNDSTFECPTCHANILSSNQVIHEAVCARQNRNVNIAPTDVNRNERQIRPQPIERQGSSSEISSIPDNMRQPQIRREERRDDRRAVENKLISCPNCDKKVYQQSLANHIDNECQGNDKIPCEFCDQLIPITFYTQHVDDCPRRAQEEQNRREQGEQNRRPAPVEESKEPDQSSRQNERPQENANRNQQQGAQQGRSRSAEQATSEREPGGFMDFLHNIASAAYNSLTQHNDNQQQQQQQREQQQRQREQQQRQQQEQQIQRQQQQREQQRQREQQQNQGSGGSFLARLLGVPEQGHRNQQTNQRSRATTPPSQHSFDPFGLFTQPPPQERQQRRQNDGYALVRTVERMPNGSLAVRMRMVPADQVGGVPHQVHQMGSRPSRSVEMEDMGPMGILMSMFGGQMPGGVQIMSFGENGEMMGQEAPRGLSKEIMNSLATVKYDKEKNKNVEPDLKSCPICLEEFQNGESVKYLWCMHRFHGGCVDNWLNEHTNCPICKKEFSEAEHHYT